MISRRCSGAGDLEAGASGGGFGESTTWFDQVVMLQRELLKMVFRCPTKWRPKLRIYLQTKITTIKVGLAYLFLLVNCVSGISLYWYFVIGDHVCLSDQITVRLIRNSLGSTLLAASDPAISLCREAVEPFGLPPLEPLAVLVFPLETAWD